MRSTQARPPLGSVAMAERDRPVGPEANLPPTVGFNGRVVLDAINSGRTIEEIRKLF
jgi:hypothetical protein